MVHNHILVAIDHSPQMPIVLQEAMDIAQAEKANLLLLHVLQPEPEPKSSYFMGIGTIADLNLYQETHSFHDNHIQKHIEATEAWLRNFAQEAMQRSIPAEFSHRIGDPGRCICEVARSWNADLIILGRRGRQGFSEWVLGSVSNDVVHHAPCSVLVVQGTAHPAIQNASASVAAMIAGS